LFFSKAFGPALGCSQSPVQCISAAPSSVVKWPGREPDHSLPSNAVINNKCSHTSTPSYIFVVCTETTLPFPSCFGYALDVCSKFHQICLKRKKILYSYFSHLLHILLLSVPSST